MCQSGELCCHSGVCAEKIIRVLTQIYKKKKKKAQELSKWAGHMNES